MSDWQKGDLALCINAKDEFDVGYCLLELGQVYTVVGVDLRDADIWGVGLYLAEVTAIETGSHYGSFWGGRFRKIRPSAIKHIEALKDVPLPVRENEHA